ncbi:F-box/WD-40 repeat-containing protein At3g52030 isoform X2 [Punica granatum]|uniref:F-box/WD-40 repeat-containing protein At3g52030 isoform X2 n=2 Tax=Punica granatum TaxID=22663 RepID=A0A218X080_PUNGR|nr:F-box/WD-40 repeat-containing protein At3g52030 isoform X2 [Punica granatum]OWM78407.1 hypothetical protein CDL15_Pgr016131 [Punica granatum]
MIRRSGPGGSSPAKKIAATEKTPINSVGQDALCTIFSLLGIFDLVRCSVVCKFWYKIINQKKLLQQFCCKHFANHGGLHDEPDISKKPWRFRLEELVMEHQKLSLTRGRVTIDQWKGHSIGVNQCRMKMGTILTGVGDKVMRLWSVESYKCLEEYSVPDTVSLVDFDFDESKIVGLIGTQLCLWRRNGQRSIFPPRAGTFPKGLCMRYLDPEAVIGCEDGSIRVFDMYSRKCSRIMRMHPGPVTCLSLSDDQFVFSGSSAGTIKVSHLSSDACVTTLRTPDITGIKALCYNPRSGLVFAGSSAGYVSCLDFRNRRKLWELRVSPSVLYSLGHMQNDDSTLVVGGMDGALHVLDQKTGEGLCSYVMDNTAASTSSGTVERRKGRRLSVDDYNSLIDKIPRTARPPVTCLAVGKNKVVTTQGKYIRLWKFTGHEL